MADFALKIGILSFLYSICMQMTDRGTCVVGVPHAPFFRRKNQSVIGERKGDVLED
jgi:hypothetical protein